MLAGLILTKTKSAIKQKIYIYKTKIITIFKN